MIPPQSDIILRPKSLLSTFLNQRPGALANTLISSCGFPHANRMESTESFSASSLAYNSRNLSAEANQSAIYNSRHRRSQLVPLANSLLCSSQIEPCSIVLFLALPPDSACALFIRESCVCESRLTPFTPTIRM
jgi:hypothetical protein